MNPRPRSHHMEAMLTPTIDQLVLVSQGTGPMSSKLEVVVEESELRVEHPDPDKPDHRRGNDIWGEERGCVRMRRAASAD